jgi:tetratricopeptide (TPR) repeat protein
MTIRARRTMIMLVGLAMVAAVPARAQLAMPPEPGKVAELIFSGRLGAAEAELQRLLALDETAVARDLLGLLRLRQERLDEAERAFRRAIELDPDLFSARRNLGRLYAGLGRRAEALAQLRKAKQLGELDQDLAFQLGVLEVEIGNVEAGEKQLESVAMRFSSVRAMLALGRSLARRGEGPMALGALYQALEVAPNSEEVMSAYARLCVEHEAPVVALKTLEALTRLYPENAEYAYLEGLAQLQLAESDAAVAAFRRSLELDPDQVLPLFAIGLSFRDQKRFSEAKEVLTESLGLMPTHADSLVVLAEVEEGLGELESAEEHLERAIELGGESPKALYVLGKIRYAQGRYEEARDALELSIEKNPQPRQVHYVLSLAYARLGDRERARKSLELYRQKTKEAEELLIKMRTDAGLGISGMRRGG